MTLRDEIVDLLSEYVDADFRKGDMVNLVDKLIDIASRDDKLSDSASRDAKSAKKSKTKTGEKTKRTYPQFVSFCSMYAKGEVEIDMQVTPVDNFKSKSSKSYVHFDEQLRDLLDNEVEFAELFKAISDSVGGTVMKIAGICWGMLCKADQDAIIANIE